MKRLLIPLLAASSIFAEEPTKEEHSYSLWDYHPIHIGGNFLQIGPASVSDVPQDGHVTYQKANAFLYMLLPISQTSYFFPRVEWNTFEFNWNNNPKFNQSRYYYAQFALTFYSTAIEKWRWILRTNYNLDLDHFNDPHDYGLFEALIWGAYQMHRKWHYHIGAFGYTGMEGRQVYPVLGFDFSPNKTWTLLLVFPLEYSLQYKLGDHWTFSLKGRPLKERFRTGKDEPQPKSVFSYSSMGAELNIRYELFMRLQAEIFGGCNFGGTFYIKDAHNHNPIYADVGTAPYGGANLDFAF